MLQIKWKLFDFCLNRNVENYLNVSNTAKEKENYGITISEVVNFSWHFFPKKLITVTVAIPINLRSNFWR